MCVCVCDVRTILKIPRKQGIPNWTCFHTMSACSYPPLLNSPIVVQLAQRGRITSWPALKTLFSAKSEIGVAALPIPFIGCANMSIPLLLSRELLLLSKLVGPIEPHTTQDPFGLVAV